MTRPRLLRAAFLSTALVLGLLGSPARARTNPSAVGLPNAPTTRVPAIGQLSAASNIVAMPSEFAETVKLDLAGEISDWRVRKGKPGIVFILDVRDAGEARTLLGSIAFGRAGVMDFDLVPLGPLVVEPALAEAVTKMRREGLRP